MNQLELSLEERVEERRVSPRAIKFMREKAKKFSKKNPNSKEFKRFQEKLGILDPILRHHSKLKKLELYMQGFGPNLSHEPNGRAMNPAEYLYSINTHLKGQRSYSPDSGYLYDAFAEVFDTVYSHIAKDKGTDYDRIVDELYKSIPGLDDGFYDVIARQLSTDLTEMQPSDIISKNKVWFAHDPESEKRVVFKLTDCVEKAHAAMIAGNTNLDFIPKNYGEPIQVGPYIIYAQEFVNLQEEGEYKQFFENIAIAHNALSETETKELRAYEPPKTNKLREILDKPLRQSGLDPNRVFGEYERRVSELEDSSLIAVIHSDLKEDNISVKKKYILDWEGIKRGNPAIDLALPLVQDKVNPALWGLAVDAYNTKMEELNPEFAQYCKEHLHKDVHSFAIIPVIKELSGIYQRPMGNKERIQSESLIAYLDKSLNANANYSAR